MPPTAHSYLRHRDGIVLLLTWLGWAWWRWPQGLLTQVPVMLTLLTQAGLGRGGGGGPGLAWAPHALGAAGSCKPLDFQWHSGDCRPEAPCRPAHAFMLQSPGCCCCRV